MRKILGLITCTVFITGAGSLCSYAQKAGGSANAGAAKGSFQGRQHPSGPQRTNGSRGQNDNKGRYSGGAGYYGEMGVLNENQPGANAGPEESNYHPQRSNEAEDLIRSELDLQEAALLAQNTSDVRSKQNYNVYYGNLPGDYVIVPPPLGAILSNIPMHYQRTVVHGVTYYHTDDETYYVHTPYGFEVVSPPL